jgi:hypothetical protein
MTNVGYRHLLRPSIDGLRTFFRYLQDALPAKLEAIHILNSVSFFDLVLRMIKPFMRADIIQKVRLSFASFFSGPLGQLTNKFV